MKLIGIDSKDRLPTERANYNNALSYDHLLLVNGRYARGCYTFIGKQWMIHEQFKSKINNKTPDSDDLKRREDWLVDNVIWFENE